MPIIFDNATVNSRERSQTVEEVYKIFASWSGIHDTEFQDDIRFTQVYVIADATDWRGTFIFSYYNTPYEFELQYSVTQYGHGGIVRQKTDGTYLLVGIDNSGNGVVKYWNGSAYVDKLFVPLNDSPTTADIRIMFRQIRFSDQESDVWNVISLWANDSLMFTYHEYIGQTILDDIGAGIVTQSTTQSFENVRIPLLSEFSEWSSLDIGEYPINGLQRAIEGRYTKFFMRFNQKLKVWRPKITSSDYTILQEYVQQKAISIDKRELATHVRVLGAYVEAKYIAYELLTKYGDRFVEINNPFLMTEAECNRQARYEIMRRMENYMLCNIEYPMMPFLEPEDHVTTEDDEYEWIIATIVYSFSPSSIKQSIRLRQYTKYGN